MSSGTWETNRFILSSLSWAAAPKSLDPIKIVSNEDATGLVFVFFDDSNSQRADAP